ncbi:MAG: SUMF1/EgtB/PvdO family nonheme iron enzyme [Bacteroidota bacterium]
MKSTHYNLWLLPLLFLVSSKEQPSRQGKDYALFFAINDYRSSSKFSNLNNPIKDAEDIAKELREMYDFEAIVHRNPTQQKIYSELRTWRNKRFQKDDQLFVFFSGHGDFDDFVNKGYFITKDAQRIDLTDLGNIITQIPCEHILLAIDACFSGTIDQEVDFKGPNFRRPNENEESNKNRLVQEQLRNNSRLLITSGGKQRTRDGKDNSPFTSALLRGLRGAYAYRDGLFLYKDILSELERVSPRPHEGELAGHQQGGFAFVSNSLAVTSSSLSDNKKKDLPDMVFIQGGTFQMGDQFGDGSEKPVHSVTVSDFYLSNHEVTFFEYDQYCADTNAERPSDESWGRGNRPVINVSWYDAVKYCNWKSEQDKLQKVYTINGTDVRANWSANGYRLPTEAEWEYAARNRGKQVRFGNGKDIADANEMNFNAEDYKETYSRKGEYKGKTMPYGSYQVSPLGLYDMSGNVWEWCWDWYSSDYYTNSKNTRYPKGPSSGSNRVRRGGSWDNTPRYCRAAIRSYDGPTIRYNTLGFRVALSSR